MELIIEDIHSQFSESVHNSLATQHKQLQPLINKTWMTYEKALKKITTKEHADFKLLAELEHVVPGTMVASMENM